MRKNAQNEHKHFAFPSVNFTVQDKGYTFPILFFQKIL